jgi:hypothetical protein
MTDNAMIAATKNKTMKATNLGLWYVQIPYGWVVSPQGEIIEPKEHNGSKFVWINRKRKPISKLPKLDYSAAMEFKKIFIS